MKMKNNNEIHADRIIYNGKFELMMFYNKKQ